jgi:hypothetical protein
MENNKEDILKKFLQDTFSDYEPEPNDASWENIFAAIQPNQPTFWGKSKPWIISGLVILMGALLWYSLGETKADNTEIALNESKTSRISESGRIRQQSDDSQTANISGKCSTGIFPVKPTNKENQPIIEKQSDESGRLERIITGMKSSVETTGTIDPFMHSQTTAEEVIVQNIDKPANTFVNKKEIIVKNNTPNAEVENHPIVERQSDESGRLGTLATDTERSTGIFPVKPTERSTGILPVKSTERSTGIFPVKPKAEIAMDINLTASTSERIETPATGIKQQSDDSQTANINPNARIDRPSGIRTQSDDSETTTTQNTIIEQVRYIRPMESLKNKDFTLTKIVLNSPVITPTISPNREAKPVRQHTYLSMSITPIQTYRILTINNNAVQNVQTNKLFDSERNGWQFDLGITKPIGKLWNFRTNLTYLRMRQWSEYQVGTNELILRNTNFGNNNSNSSQDTFAELEVVGQTVTESKNLHMVGLKMDVQKFLKITPKNRYFLSTGTQLMYENSQKQGNMFLNVSAGFQHIVSQTTFITIEPTASYSLNNFNDSKSLLQANGYNLGLKMGVSFKVK